MVMGDICKSLSYELLNEQESLDLSESRPLVLQGMQVFGQSIFCSCWSPSKHRRGSWICSTPQPTTQLTGHQVRSF